MPLDCLSSMLTLALRFFLLLMFDGFQQFWDREIEAV